MIVLLAVVNISLLLWRYNIPMEEILLCNLSVGLLYLSLKNAFDLVRSKGLHESLEEQR
ncbi:MAG: hypothetical protein RIT43_2286 [Bacteroidota bacterium]